MSPGRNYVAILSSGRSSSTLLTNLIDGVNDRIYVHPVEINFASAFNDLSKLKKISYKTKYYAKFDKIILLKRAKKKDLVNYNNSVKYSSFTKILLTLLGVLRAIKGIALRRYNIMKYILDY